MSAKNAKRASRIANAYSERFDAMFEAQRPPRLLYLLSLSFPSITTRWRNRMALKNEAYKRFALRLLADKALNMLRMKPAKAGSGARPSAWQIPAGGARIRLGLRPVVGR